MISLYNNNNRKRESNILLCKTFPRLNKKSRIFAMKVNDFSNIHIKYYIFNLNSTLVPSYKSGLISKLKFYC